MKLLYANVIEANAPWGAEIFMNDALRKSGCDTRTVDYRVHRSHLSRRFLDVGNFDAFLLQRGDHFPLKLVKAIQRPRFFYFSELFAARRDADHLFQSNLFDYYFVRGSRCRDELVQRGWIPESKIGLLLSAFDPGTYYPTASPKDIDILFIGSMTARRTDLLERLTKHFQITVRSAFGAAASELYNRAKLILNLHANDYLDTETRVYEVLGAGGFLITETLAHENPFSSKEHLIETETFEDLVEQISYYLRHEDERMVIATQGHASALAEHTYPVRIRQIMRTIEATLPQAELSSEALDNRQLGIYRIEEQIMGFRHVLKEQVKRVIRSQVRL